MTHLDAPIRALRPPIDADGDVEPWVGAAYGLGFNAVAPRDAWDAYDDACGRYDPPLRVLRPGDIALPTTIDLPADVDPRRAEVLLQRAVRAARTRQEGFLIDAAGWIEHPEALGLDPGAVRGCVGDVALLADPPACAWAGTSHTIKIRVDWSSARGFAHVDLAWRVVSPDLVSSGTLECRPVQEQGLHDAGEIELVLPEVTCPTRLGLNLALTGRPAPPARWNIAVMPRTPFPPDLGRGVTLLDGPSESLFELLARGERVLLQGLRGGHAMGLDARDLPAQPQGPLLTDWLPTDMLPVEVLGDVLPLDGVPPLPGARITLGGPKRALVFDTAVGPGWLVCCAPALLDRAATDAALAGMLHGLVSALGDERRQPETHVSPDDLRAWLMRIG